MNKLKPEKKTQSKLARTLKTKKINKLYFCCVIPSLGKYAFFDLDTNYREIIGSRDNNT